MTSQICGFFLNNLWKSVTSKWVITVNQPDEYFIGHDLKWEHWRDRIPQERGKFSKFAAWAIPKAKLENRLESSVKSSECRGLAISKLSDSQTRCRDTQGCPYEVPKGAVKYWKIFIYLFVFNCLWCLM